MADAFVFFLNCFVTLFSILDPFGAAVVLLGLTPDETEERRAEQVRRAIQVTLIILLLFMIAGEWIFAVFGISIQALMVAGGLILIHMAFKMLQGAPVAFRSTKPEREEAEKKEDIAVIPLAIPMLAGPAAITAVIVFANRASGAVDWIMLLGAIVLSTGVTYAILRQSQKIAGMLGDTGQRIVVRIMGLILMAMGVEFVLSAVKGYFG